MESNSLPSNSPRWTLTYQDTVYAILEVQAVTGHDFNITPDHINWALQLDSSGADGAPEILHLRIPRYHLRSRVVFDQPSPVHIPPVLSGGPDYSEMSRPASVGIPVEGFPELMANWVNTVLDPPTQRLAPGSVPNLNPLQALAESAAAASRLGYSASPAPSNTPTSLSPLGAHHLDSVFTTLDGGSRRPLLPSTNLHMPSAPPPSYASDYESGTVDIPMNDGASDTDSISSKSDDVNKSINGSGEDDEDEDDDSEFDVGSDNNNCNSNGDTNGDANSWSHEHQNEDLGESWEDYLAEH